MDRYNTALRLSAMRKKAREDAGVSQEKLAKLLGVSRKTIQNWEDGCSSPSELMAMEWFHALGLSPLKYYLQFLYPDNFGKIETDKEVENALIACVRGCSPARQRKLLFMFQGDHGGSPLGMIELIAAHLHLPISNRVHIAQNVLNSYEIAQAREELRIPAEAVPDIDLLRRAMIEGKEAAMIGKEDYMKGRKT